MGQTLTNGVYLPDEGERNCYAGLAANWQLLDGAVGTVAEHTSALAGKAPLVHTHKKSDVTDLLNSNFIPSANNSYDLGSSSNQWNNLYAKNYYYNGVAWGLDKANTWTQNQTVKNGSASYILVNTNVTKGVIPANNRNITFSAKDTNGEEIGRVLTRVTPQGETYTWLAAHNFYKDGTLDPTGTEKWANITCFISSDGSTHVETNGDFIPDNGTTNANLGTSTNKWTTFNGINPGALSLPDTTREEPIDRTNWVYTYTSANIYYPPEDGWVVVACSGSDYMQIDSNAGWGITLSKGYDGFCIGIIPVKKNERLQIRIRETSSGSVVVRKASFYPGTGDPSFTVTSSS